MSANKRKIESMESMESMEDPDEEEFYAALLENDESDFDENEHLCSPENSPWMKKFEELLTAREGCKVTTHETISPEEISLTKEIIEKIRNPSEKEASRNRWFVRAEYADKRETQLWLIKMSTDTVIGRNELVVSEGLMQHNIEHMIPAEFGFESTLFSGKNSCTYYFAASKFKKNVFLLQDFQNRPPYEISTVQIVEAVMELLKSMFDAYKKLHFAHGDFHGKQVLVEKTSSGIYLWLIDFGHSRIKFTKSNGLVVSVEPRVMSSGRDFFNDISGFVSVLTGVLSKAKPKDLPLGTAWVRNTNKLANKILPIVSYVENMEAALKKAKEKSTQEVSNTKMEA